ncbi:MAG: phenylacetate--CoA ligase family protein [Planctomycetota bacterium]
MSRLLNKAWLTLGTYRQARLAIARQFKPEQIIKAQNTKLRNLIRHSFDNIKYYREAFERVGVKPEQIKTAEDLRNIPILTKEQLRERFWDFLPRDLFMCRVSRTSGSTGIPVCILSDRNSRMFNSAGVIRYRKELGISLIGAPILTPLKTANEPWRKQAHWTFLQGIHKTFYINPYVDLQENAEYAKKLLAKLRKPALIGITPAIRALAYRVRDGFFPHFEPKVTITTGECISLQTRKLIESTFGVKVADVYACTEAGDVAWQCHVGSGYHVNADNVIVEIIRNGEPAKEGQVGEVLVTNLNRYAMPMIRFKNGDLAKLSHNDCPCGCKLPMIAEIVGRTGEDILLPDGRTMPWNLLKSPMNHPHVRQFQIVQDGDGGLTVGYVAEPDADCSAMGSLLHRRFRELLGPSIAIEINKVDRIPPDPSGKCKLVISNYAPLR